MEIQPLKKEDRKFTMEVHQSEFNLLKAIRERFQFGPIEIICKNGLPFEIRKYVETLRTWVD